jgi:hypothetical protein
LIEQQEKLENARKIRLFCCKFPIAMPIGQANPFTKFVCGSRQSEAKVSVAVRGWNGHPK